MRTSARTQYEQAASMFVVGDLTEARNVAAALSAPWSVEEADACFIVRSTSEARRSRNV